MTVPPLGPMPGPAFADLAVALGLGLLVGLQRERHDPRIAGLRTFGLVTLLGAIAALLTPQVGGWLIPTGLLAVVAMTLFGNFVVLRSGEEQPGITTEITLLVMFLVGALAVLGPRELAVVVGGTVAVLLHSKRRLHTIIERLGKEDVRAIMQFTLLALVILPMLPNQDFGPYGVLNPWEIWLIVVLIVGISLAGYIGYKFLGEKTGLFLAGVLGGLISSTATTVSYARRSGTTSTASRLAAVVIMIASAIALLRVLVAVAVVAPDFLPVAAPPIGLLFVFMAIVSALLWWRSRQGDDGMPEQQNPTELKPALLFGALYAIVLFAVAFVQERFGSGELYGVAALAGLTDLAAITLSTARVVIAGGVSAEDGWRMIMVANLANLAFKTGVVAVLGSRALLIRIALLHGLTAVAVIALIIAWPG